MPDNKGYNITSSGTNSQVSHSFVFVCIFLSSDVFKFIRVIITVPETMVLQQPTRILTTTPTRKFDRLSRLYIRSIGLYCTSDNSP